MSRILALSMETAEGPQRAILEKAVSEVGYLSGTRRLLLVDPQLGMPGRQLYEYLNLRPDSPFSRLQREMVATVVYGLIGAKPCLSAHCEAIRRLTGDDDLGPEFVQKWPEYPIDAMTRALLRYAKRLTCTMDELQAFYDAAFPRLEEAMAYLDKFDLNALPDDATRLLWLCYSLVNASFPVEVWRQARVPDSGAASIDVVVEPAV